MPFATADDVAVRLGRELTEAETAMAEQVIEGVTAEIASAATQNSAWAAALDPVPVLFRTLCIDKVIAVGANPSGLASESMALGTLQKSRTYNGAGALLTEAEKRLVRKVVFGSFRPATLTSPYSGDDETLPELTL